MSADTFIWLGDDLQDPWMWTDTDGVYHLAQSVSEKNDIAQYAGKTICTVLSGQCVRMFEHDLPKMREKEKLSAAGFAIEGELAAPLDTLHIVMGQDNDSRVAVVSKEKLKSIITALNHAGIEPDIIVADFDVIDPQNGPVKFSDRIIMPGALGYTQDLAWAEQANLSEVSIEAIDEHLNVEGAINLRQGEFAKQASLSALFDGSFSGVSPKGLRRAAVLIGLMGLAGLSVYFVSLRAKGQHIDYITSQTAQLYSKSSGEAAPSNPALAAARAMKAKPQSRASFLTLSHALVETVRPVDGLIVDKVQYDNAQEQLHLRLIYPAFETTSQLEQAALQTGAIFKAGGVREQSGALIGDAVLSLKVRP
ncbi:MAG: type II secretion system protein GspL [Maricaulaceae bacterium]